METKYPYVIVGGGLCAASAVEGIRSRDRDGKILLLSRENNAPYNRPPLTKGLWSGKDSRDNLPVYPDTFYRENNVELALRREIVEIDPSSREVWDDRGASIGYEQLLLATGGRPRLLEVPGGTGPGVQYYRTLDDYLRLEGQVGHVQHVLLVGAGFIGLELAASLRGKNCEVTIVYPEEYPLRRVIPRDLGMFLAEFYRDKGVETISGESVTGIEEEGGLIVARTAAGNQITTQLVVCGVGMVPNTDLGDAAGLEGDRGIEVDEYGRTSDPRVFAAGDVAEYPLLALGMRTRTEHEDHARMHGKVVGANMAGAQQKYDHIPMFYSDMFELGWEAVGDLSPHHQTEAVWKEEFREGVIYYLSEGVVVGALMWNVWGQVDRAREIIRAQQPMTHDERVQAIPLG